MRALLRREQVQHGERPARLERVVDPAKQRHVLLGAQVVDQVEAERAVVGTAEVDLERVALAVLDAVGHAVLGDDLPADRRAAGKVDDGGLEPGMPAAQLRREPAVAARHVEQRGRLVRQPQRFRHLGRGQPGELELAANVGLPGWVLGRRVVQLEALARPDDLLELRPPVPVLGAVLDEGADVRLGRGVQPAPRGLRQLVAAPVALHVPERVERVEQQARARRRQLQLARELVRAGRPLRQPLEDPEPHAGDDRARHRHPEHRLADRPRGEVESQGEPLGRVLGPKVGAHGAG